MMKRIGSEARQAGMASNRRCCDCGALLTNDDGERCSNCCPRLNEQAQAAGARRRAELEDIGQTERMIENLQMLIRRIDRKDRRLS